MRSLGERVLWVSAPLMRPLKKRSPESTRTGLNPAHRKCGQMRDPSRLMRVRWRPPFRPPHPEEGKTAVIRPMKEECRGGIYAAHDLGAKRRGTGITPPSSRNPPVEFRPIREGLIVGTGPRAWATQGNHVACPYR